MVVALKGPMKAAKSNKLAVLFTVSAGLIIAGDPCPPWPSEGHTVQASCPHHAMQGSRVAGSERLYASSMTETYK